MFAQKSYAQILVENLPYVPALSEGLEAVYPVSLAAESTNTPRPHVIPVFVYPVA